VHSRASYYLQPIQEVVNEKSIGTEMNDLDLCLKVASRSSQPLRYIRRWISWKPLDICLGPKDHQQEMAYGEIKWSC